MSNFFLIYEIVLISFSATSTLVYRNTTSSSVLVLYPTTLLNSLITSNMFFVELQKLILKVRHIFENIYAQMVQSNYFQ